MSNNLPHIHSSWKEFSALSACNMTQGFLTLSGKVPYFDLLCPVHIKVALHVPKEDSRVLILTV